MQKTKSSPRISYEEIKKCERILIKRCAEARERLAKEKQEYKEEDASTREDLISHHTKTIEDCEIALRAIEKGEYGICTICGESINPERLKIRPESIRCVPCKEKRNIQ